MELIRWDDPNPSEICHFCKGKIGFPDSYFVLRGIACQDIMCHSCVDSLREMFRVIEKQEHEQKVEAIISSIINSW